MHFMIYSIFNIAERKSMHMEMISGEMHSDTVAIRQKKYNLESGNL